MTKKLFSILRYTSIVALVASLFIISGCSDDKEPAPTLTISQIIASDAYKQSATVTADAALDSTNKYFNLYPDLQALMTGTTSYTLFAPSNAAFISLTAIPGLSNLKAVNPDIIKGVLLYHFVAEQKLKSDLTSGSSFPTLYSETRFITTESPTLPSVQNIKINTDGTLKTGSSNASIVITKENIKATNGVVHITGTALIPPSVGAVLVPILGTMAATVLLGKDFSNLAKVILTADASFTENAGTGEFRIATWLAMSITSASKVTANAKGLTFFAPPNKAGTTDVFTETLANTLIASADKGRSVILNHLVVSGQYTVADAPANNPLEIKKFSNGQAIVPKTGASRVIGVSVGTASASNPFGVAISNTPSTPASYRPIVAKDIATLNGTIQVFAGLLGN